MPVSLLDAQEHYCFHSPVLNIHEYPDLHVCTSEECNAAIHPTLAKQAGLHNADTDVVSCPKCGSDTELVEGEKKAEVHVKMCTDITIHYPEMRKAGTISPEDYAAWKATLSREELLGHYKRVPDHHLVVPFTHEETSLLDTDKEAFTTLMQSKTRDCAESALLHQIPHRHVTTTRKVDFAPTIQNTSST